MAIELAPFNMFSSQGVYVLRPLQLGYWVFMADPSLDRSSDPLTSAPV
jgi:hypothetical protein